ncbi:LCP family protein [Amycolatopsis endophytica]|uniref:LCP family protein required for cell wall assembly n=1 Tax=Amycolatopsis endophytica TaxID=860233 RepID=A0A853AXU6_9PSEU|nr:LCP family protein [Amycolatopsis endophytica]NYI87538.1 LCP family protein required for cell wall assembly [Amycolatopsis endophytica]
MDDEDKPTPYPRPKPPADEPEVAAAPRRRRRPVRATGKALLALVSVAALVATGYAWATYHQVQGNVHTTDALDLPDDKPAPPADDGADDILLVGADARTDMQGNALPLTVLKTLRTEQTSGVNTDTIIVVRIPKNGAKPYALSIPRDTWIDVPRGGQGKINSVYGLAKQARVNELRRDGERDPAEIERDSDQAGRQSLVQAVQDFTQVRVDHYAEVNLLGFYLITEALGGVQVCLNHATEDKDSGADFAAGVQTVSGGEALSFVRQRKNLPHGDLDRIVRQQAFLSSALHKVLSAGVLTNPGTLGELTDALHRSLVLDANFDLLQFADRAKGLASGDVTFTTIPVITINGRSPDGQQSIVEVDPVAVRQFFAGLAGRAPSGGGASGGGASGGGASGGGAVSRAVPAGVTCVN